MSSPLCKYSGMFGEPGRGAHSIRVGGLAAVDLIGAAGLAFVAAKYGAGRTDAAALLIAFILVMMCSVIIHEAFCVNTRLNAAIFGRPWPGAAPSPPEAKQS